MRIAFSVCNANEAQPFSLVQGKKLGRRKFGRAPARRLALGGSHFDGQ
jgi:hypothetical protein